MNIPRLRCVDLTKSFGGIKAIENLDIRINQGEILALLGPSGCGKTTALRLIAGFETPDEGLLEIGGRIIVGPGILIPPEKRSVGMMFQEYALFPHMTVEGNISYGLSSFVGRSEYVQDMLDLVGLTGMGKRMPHQLSGGEQQRVALARALAPAPQILLLDEPFSNLDASLRTQIQQEALEILRYSNTTAVFVTHSQEEAMAMGDVIAIMDSGRIEQIGTPQDIFHSPVNKFVASFIGLSNFLNASISNGLLYSELGHHMLREQTFSDGQVEIMIRPSDIHLEEDQNGHGRITKRTFQGSFYLYEIALVSGTIIKVLLNHLEEHQIGIAVRLSVREGAEPTIFVDGAAVR